MSESPELLYLQWTGSELDSDSTWCSNKINDDDVEYIKKSTSDRLRGLLECIEKNVREHKYPHRRVCPSCDCGIGIRFTSIGNSIVLEHADDCELAKELADE